MLNGRMKSPGGQGVSYQDYMRKLVHEAIEREMA
jgi:hypothetical protein